MTDVHHSQAYHEEQPTTNADTREGETITLGSTSGAGDDTRGGAAGLRITTPALEVWLPAANGPRLPRPWDVSLYR